MECFVSVIIMLPCIVTGSPIEILRKPLLINRYATMFKNIVVNRELYVLKYYFFKAGIYIYEYECIHVFKICW